MRKDFKSDHYQILMKIRSEMVFKNFGHENHKGTHSGILFRPQEEGNADIGYNRMRLEDTMPSEISQSQTDTLRVHFSGVPGVVKFMEIENRMVVARGWGMWGDMGLFNGDFTG